MMLRVPVPTLLRFLVVLVVIAVVGIGPASASATAVSDVAASVSAQSSAATSGTESVPIVDDAAVADDEGAGPAVVRGVIGAAVLIGVFVFGLTRIREQRRTGRTSKFPRIG